MTLFDLAHQFYRRNVRPRLPSSVHRLLLRLLFMLSRLYLVIFDCLHSEYSFWRVKAWPTKLLGPQYRRSRDDIEINITYACNLRCYNCNRSCGEAPTGMQMTVDQIQYFIKESVAARYCWNRIAIIGGEPTTHRQLFEIVDLLREYRDLYSPHTSIEVWTNGYGANANRVISQLPLDVVIINDKKDPAVKAVPTFVSFNVAPGDLDEYGDADFRNGCWITEHCGMGLGPSGYYPCGIAPGMDRIFGWNVGLQSLPSRDDPMQGLLDRFCRNCGFFKRRSHARGSTLEAPLGGPVSPSTWDRAYSEYRRQAPRLVQYGESGRSRTGSAASL